MVLSVSHPSSVAAGRAATTASMESMVSPGGLTSSSVSSSFRSEIIRAAENGTSGLANLKPGIDLGGWIDKFSNQWAKTERMGGALMQKLPDSVRPLFEAQVLVNELSLKSQMISKVGETLGSTLRRVQQLGGGS